MTDLLIVLVLLFLQLNSANTTTSCSLIRTINQQGFHRKLTTSVLVALPSKSNPEQCVTVLKEVLPSGAYIDPYQIHRLKEIQIVFQSEVDIEKPEYLSPQQKLLVYIQLQPTFKVDYLKTEVILPFHLRYHQPKFEDDSMATINIDPPTQVFTNCTDGFSALEHMPCSSSDSNLCLWQKLNCKGATMMTNIPVGDLNHLIPVSFITILSTFGSTALLLHQMIKYQT